MTGVDSTLHVCPGCGAKVIGHKTCGDPTRPGCATTATTVTEEAVEAAAQASYEAIPGVWPWSSLTDNERQPRLTRARAALVAALPYLQTQIDREALVSALEIAGYDPQDQADAVLALLSTEETK